MVGRQQLSGKSEEIRFTARGKDQPGPVLFGAAICHPEQFFSLISLLPQNRRAGGVLIVVCVFPFIFVIDLHFCFCMASCFLCMPIHWDVIEPTFLPPIH